MVTFSQNHQYGLKLSTSDCLFGLKIRGLNHPQSATYANHLLLLVVHNTKGYHRQRTTLSKSLGSSDTSQEAVLSSLKMIQSMVFYWLCHSTNASKGSWSKPVYQGYIRIWNFQCSFVCRSPDQTNTLQSYSTPSLQEESPVRRLHTMKRLH